MEVNKDNIDMLRKIANKFVLKYFNYPMYLPLSITNKTSANKVEFKGSYEQLRNLRKPISFTIRADFLQENEKEIVIIEILKQCIRYGLFLDFKNYSLSSKDYKEKCIEIQREDLLC